MVQSLDCSKPGNIDIRYGFRLGGVPTDIVGFNDRDGDDLAFYRVDPKSRKLSLINTIDGGKWPKEMYGFALMHDRRTGQYNAFGCGKKGQIRQWKLFDDGGKDRCEGHEDLAQRVQN